MKGKTINVHGILNVAMAIVGVAAVTTIVAHPQSARVITAIGDAFQGSIKTAIGG